MNKCKMSFPGETQWDGDSLMWRTTTIKECLAPLHTKKLNWKGKQWHSEVHTYRPSVLCKRSNAFLDMVVLSSTCIRWLWKVPSRHQIKRRDNPWHRQAYWLPIPDMSPVNSCHGKAQFCCLGPWRGHPSSIVVRGAFGAKIRSESWRYCNSVIWVNRWIFVLN